MRAPSVWSWLAAAAAATAGGCANELEVMTNKNTSVWDYRSFVPWNITDNQVVVNSLLGDNQSLILK